MVNKTLAYVLSTALTLPLVAHAGLEPLDDSTLSNKSGQAQFQPYDPSRPSIVFDIESRYNLESDFSKICDADNADVACNVGVALNNRYEDGDKKQWLVFKNVTGAIKVSELKYTGQDIDVAPKGAEDKRATLAFTINNNATPATRNDTNVNWIELNKFGFESLAVESDTAAEINADGSFNASNEPGYRNASLAEAPAGGFDDGKYRGFLGLDTTANIGINGTMKIFSCAGYRCQ